MAVDATWSRPAHAAIQARRRVRTPSDLALALYLASAAVLALQFASPAFRHWFVLPLALCGGLIGADAIAWLRRRVDLFDPVGILGLLGVHFFFLAPLLHVHWDRWMQLYGLVLPPADWRTWLGAMAVLNLLGLSVYRLTRRPTAHTPAGPHPEPAWRLNKRAFPVILAFALLITFALQMAVYRQFGGLVGYIQRYEAREGAFTGMGWVFMISESFPILAFMGYAAYARNRPWAKSWAALGLALVAFLALKLLFGGLRGSRSNTMWGLFWAVGIVHFWLRPIGRKLIYIGLAFLVIFMYAYGFYKGGGLDALLAARDPSQWATLEESTGRTLEGVLLGDLGRADVQAFLLYRLTQVRDYGYAWGRTYAGGAAVLIPRALWPDRPPTKIEAGTEAQYGQGTWIPGVFSSTRIYGLAGEAMLNFGWPAVPLAFALLGWVVRRVRAGAARWHPADTRWLLLPVLVNLCFLMLVSDSDNVVFVLVKNGALPFLVVWFGSCIAGRKRLGSGVPLGCLDEDCEVPPQ